MVLQIEIWTLSTKKLSKTFCGNFDLNIAFQSVSKWDLLCPKILFQKKMKKKKKIYYLKMCAHKTADTQNSC